jgi:hypothetical protein
MRLFGFLPVIGRRVVVAFGVAGMVLMASTAQAQTPAAQAAADDPLKFSNASPVMIVMTINQGQEAAFEAGFNEMRSHLTASAKPEFAAQGKSLQLLKVDATPVAGQPSIYLMYLDPPVTDQSYSITSILYYGGAFDVSTPEARKKVDDLYEKFKASVAGQNIWPIAKK